MLFHNISAGILRWIVKQPNVKEESLTDRLLYEVSEGSDRFIYKSFSRNEESFNGADWEWWVLTAEPIFKAYRFLVQAKKLKMDGRDKYAQLCYTNRNGMQIDLLIDNAKKRNAMPLYMFYSSGKASVKVQHSNMEQGFSNIIEWCESCDNGAYFAPAHTVRGLLFNEERHFISSEYLLSYSLKLSLLDLLMIGLDVYNDRGRIDEKTPNDYMRIIERLYMKQGFSKYSNDYSNSITGSGIMHTSNEIPYYLRALIEQKQGIDQWFESEFSEQCHGLSGVAVLDLRPCTHRSSKL